MGHPLGDHAGPESSRRRLGDPSAENQLDVIRPTDVQVLADHLLEEHAAGSGTVQDLGQGEFGLEDRHVIAVPSPAILGDEGWGRSRSHFRSRVSIL